MTFEELTDSVVNAMIGVMSIRRWNKYVAGPADRFLTKVEHKIEVHGPKIDAYVDAHIVPKLQAAVNYIDLHGSLIIGNVERRVDGVVDTIEYISSSIQSPDVINYAVKAIILGAIIDVEARVIHHAESKNWEEIPDTDYDLIQTIDHIVAKETLDIAELEDDIITVKAADGSQSQVPLSRIIGD